VGLDGAGVNCGAVGPLGYEVEEVGQQALAILVLLLPRVLDACGRDAVGQAPRLTIVS